MLLHASGGDHVLGGNGAGGLLADFASLILAPPRLLAGGYRRLLEWTVRLAS